ncbi:MAG: hypothetical protein LBO75_02390 [Bifidobacteriaceae bacterium]|jgi:hypothetical protein|nr:hypothetical protein [Bifidobacteriaceae bacterium]
MRIGRGKKPGQADDAATSGSLKPHKGLFLGVAIIAVFGVVVAGLVFWGFQWVFPTPEETDATAWLYNLVRSTIAVVGVLTGGGAAFIAYRRQRAFEIQTKLDRTRLDTERYMRAVDQLGNSAPAIRLGGIYALEHLAKESGPIQEMIVEVLAGFTRNSIAELKLSVDSGDHVSNEDKPGEGND